MGVSVLFLGFRGSVAAALVLGGVFLLRALWCCARVVGCFFGCSLWGRECGVKWAFYCWGVAVLV